MSQQHKKNKYWETHDTVVRFAPPLVIKREQIEQTVAALAKVLARL